METYGSKMWEAGKRMGFQSIAPDQEVADYLENLDGAKKGLGDNKTDL